MKQGVEYKRQATLVNQLTLIGFSQGEGWYSQNITSMQERSS